VVPSTRGHAREIAAGTVARVAPLRFPYAIIPASAAAYRPARDFLSGLYYPLGPPLLRPLGINRPPRTSRPPCTRIHTLPYTRMHTHTRVRRHLHAHTYVHAYVSAPEYAPSPVSPCHRFKRKVGLTQSRYRRAFRLAVSSKQL